jgi:Fe-S-cluster-containing hydrogenase component 2
VIYVDEERCTGCGLCVEACPTEAISLMDGVAQIEQSLCRECEVCLSACPNGAILALQEPAPVRAPAPIPTPARPAAPAPQPSGGVRTWVGTAMAFIEREVVPRAAALWENRGRPGIATYHPTSVSGRGNYGRRGRGRRARRRRGRW